MSDSLRPSSMPPPASSGGNTKLVLIGVGFLLISLAAVVAVTLNRPAEDPADRRGLGPGQQAPQRSTALTDDSFDIPDDSLIQPPEDNTPTKTTKRAPRPAAAECSGDINQSAAATVMAQNRAAIQRCYENQLKRDPLLQGTLNITLRVGSDGEVAGSSIGGSLRNPEVSSCVRGVVARMRFPRVTGGSCAQISQPFSFSPRS